MTSLVRAAAPALLITACLHGGAAARAADPVYALFGVVGIGVDDWPPPDHPVGDRVGYRLRPGGHEMSTVDWEYYLRFFDRQR